MSDDIDDLVGAGELGQALDRLKEAAQGDARAKQEVILLQARVNRLQRDQRNGVLRRDDYEIEVNRLSIALLALRDILRAQRQPGSQAAGAGQWSAAAPGAAPRETGPLAAALGAAAAGTPEGQVLEPFELATKTGLSALRPIGWVEAGLNAARGVCQIRVREHVGTGFLIADGVLITNHHLLGTADQAARARAEFYAGPDGARIGASYALEAEHFYANAALDYALVRVRPEDGKPPLASWGVLTLGADADPAGSPHLSVIQHASDGHKQMILTARFALVAAPPALHYVTDTPPGSDGAPVFDDAWRVVAIHHGFRVDPGAGAERYTCEAILLSAIRRDAGPRWPQAR